MSSLGKRGGGTRHAHEKIKLGVARLAICSAQHDTNELGVTEKGLIKALYMESLFFVYVVFEMLRKCVEKSNTVDLVDPA